MPLKIVALEVGPLLVNCYLIGTADKSCLIIDPGDDADLIVSNIRQLGWRPEVILLTHSHYDHIGAVGALLAAYPECVLACSETTSKQIIDPIRNLSVYLGNPISSPSASRILKDGERFDAMGVEWIATEIPGHDPGEMVYYCAMEGIAFSGDVIFFGSIGRSDFPGGDGDALLKGLLSWLKSVPPQTVIFPGHGPQTSVQQELKHNPFLT